MKEVRIKDICKKGSSSLKQKDVEKASGKYPVYGASGIIGSLDSYHQSDDYIAIVKDGSGIGRVLFLPAQSSVIGTMQYILPKPGFDINYIGYCLQSLGLSRYKQGAAIPHIYFRDYGDRAIRVEDSLEEQKKIVLYLNTCFSKIDKVKANAKASLDEARSLFQAILRDNLAFRKGWSKKKIGDVITDIHYGTSSPSSNQGEYTYLRMNNISSDGHFVLKDLKYITLSGRELENSIVRKGDILFNRTNSLEHVGKTCVFDLDEPMVIAGYIIRMRLGKEVLPHYFSYFLNSDSTKQILRKIAVGAVHQSNISAKNIQKVEIAYPTISEQKLILQRVLDAEGELALLKRNYDTICSECDALKLKLLKDIFG